MSKQRSPEQPLFADLMSFRLHTLAKRVDQHAEVCHRRETGVSLLEARIIGVVGAHGPIAFKALCAMAELEKSNASRLVARLVEVGLIERQDDPSDQRSFFLLATPTGRKMRHEIHRQARLRNERWLSVLSESQQATLSECLHLLDAQARRMALDDPASQRVDLDALPEVAEPDRLAWIDRRLAEQLHALLGNALAKSSAEGNTP